MQKKHYLILDQDFLWLEQTTQGWQLPQALALLPYFCPHSEQWLLNHQDTQFVYIEFTHTQAPPALLTRFHLRDCATLLTADLFKIIGRAKQLHEWQQTHRFCGRCGTKTVSADHDKARECSDCHFIAYPRIAPCVLVAIYHKDQILLARSHHFRAGLYSALAGFIEAGESAEECAIREVQEEVGLSIGPLTYFGSQTWPFPNQLMLAYSAEFRHGNLSIDPIEIEAAQWFHFNELPLLAEPHTLAYQLIQQVKIKQGYG